MNDIFYSLKKNGKKIIIWGAGESGSIVYDLCTQNGLDVIFFIDKNYKDMANGFMGKKVLPPPTDEAFIKETDAFILVASINFFEEIINTLQLMGLEKDRDFINTVEIITDIFLEKKRQNHHEYLIKKFTPEYVAKLPLFMSVEIETHNRCNGVCTFCPVNSKTDPRKYLRMSEKLFSSIIDQLAELDYSGRIAPFCNNEPFLDNRIISFLKEIREKLPKSWLYLFTNGTLLTVEKFLETMKYLDRLIIDNYNEKYELIPQVEKIYRYCLSNESIAKKVKIHKCLVNQKLSTRAGSSPNREKIFVKGITCMNPFRAVVIRPDGKVSLCCNDVYGYMTLGDLTKQSLLDVWYGKDFSEVREKLYPGRENLSLCSKCDLMQLDLEDYDVARVENELLSIRPLSIYDRLDIAKG